MNSSFFKNIGSEHGGALLNVMVAVGLGGIVVAGMTQMMTNSMKAQKRVSNDVDKSAIKQMLLDVVDCKETLDHCNGTQPSKVYRHRKDGPELFIENTGTGSRFGFWTLRASCNGTDDGLIVRAARLKAEKSLLSTNETDFQPDPLNNSVYTWKDDQSLLFGDGIELCGNAKSSGECKIIDYPKISVGGVKYNIGFASIHSMHYCMENNYDFGEIVLSHEKNNSHSCAAYGTKGKPQWEISSNCTVAKKIQCCKI